MATAAACYGCCGRKHLFRWPQNLHHGRNHDQRTFVPAWFAQHGSTDVARHLWRSPRRSMRRKPWVSPPRLVSGTGWAGAIPCGRPLACRWPYQLVLLVSGLAGGACGRALSRRRWRRICPCVGRSDVWYRNFHGFTSRCVAPYHAGLRRWSAYCSSSNGKQRQVRGRQWRGLTLPRHLWCGAIGTNGCMLFQIAPGPDVLPLEIVAVRKPSHALVVTIRCWPMPWRKRKR